jgi:tetratricopeptide (TPR) repeat protein
MKRTIGRLSVATLLALLPFALGAQALPKPKEFYFEDDAQVTRPVVLHAGSDDATVQKLLDTRNRRRRNADMASGQLAHIAYASGRSETGAALYVDALTGTSSAPLRMSLHWNHGWDLYRAGDAAAAIEQWRLAGVDRLKGPSWVPPTLALALWSLGNRDEALRWYAAAVRTEPGLWQSPDLARLLPDWREEDRARLAEVAAAWRAAPPAWP